MNPRAKRNKRLTHIELVTELRSQRLLHGSTREMARQIGISHSYLADVLKAAKLPGPSILRYMKLRRCADQPMYERAA